MPNRKKMHAYILGSGLQSLTAAVHLIQEAHVPPSHIHIIEALAVAGGTTASNGDAQNGYDFRAGMRPQFNDVCMESLLSLVPSKSDPSRTVRDEILEHAESLDVRPGQTQTKFLKRRGDGIGVLDGRRIALGVRDRFELFVLGNKSEKALGRARICDCFSEGFFRSGYWMALATTFGLKPSHSASEFRRYLQRFNNLHDLSSPRPLDLGAYNVHESIIVPIASFLQKKGVDFRFNTTVTDISFTHNNPSDVSDPTRVKAIQTAPAEEMQSTASVMQETTIQLDADDIVLISLGSVYSSILTGTNEEAPSSFDPSGLAMATATAPSIDMNNAAASASSGRASQPELTPELDENWLLWLELCTKHRKFGNAYNFCTRIQSSRLESFTVTCSSPEFLDRLSGSIHPHHHQQWHEGGGRGRRKGSEAMTLSITDHPWTLTLRIPPQPLFPSQPADVNVIYGYSLTPEKPGSYIQKPMLHCTGKEILSEILSHFSFPMSILESAITVPCIQPRASATLLPRTTEDRPTVVPRGMTNMALIGPFVEIEGEVVVTADYSVRGAQMGVRELMGLGHDKDIDGVDGGSGRRKSRKGSVKGLFGL